VTHTHTRTWHSSILCTRSHMAFKYIMYTLRALPFFIVFKKASDGEVLSGALAAHARRAFGTILFQCPPYCYHEQLQVHPAHHPVRSVHHPVRDFCPVGGLACRRAQHWLKGGKKRRGGGEWGRGGGGGLACRRAQHCVKQL